MAELIPLALFYDPVEKNWYLYAPDKTAAFKRQTLYWGVPLTPISMNVLDSPQPPPGTIPMKALLAPGKVLGPLLGILTAENPDGSVKGNFPNYKAIMRTGKKIGGIVFAFTPSSVDWGKKIIQGKVFHTKTRRWVTCPVPFPNVVYNRIMDRAHENKESSQLCIRRFLSQPGINLYNRGFFNKKEIISILSKSPKISKHIPATKMLKSRSDLINMLKRYSAVYLKPSDSRLGTGIIRIIKAYSPKYVMQYYAHDKVLKSFRTNSMDQLWHKIRQEMLLSPYLVQQAILLASVSACPFDCRVLVQKNRQGRWQISGVGLRVAGQSHSITTHVPRGGHIDAPARVLPQVFPKQKAAKIEKRIHRLCLAVARTIEEHHRVLGEMSIDLGLDRHGHPWVFEANAKPMKFDEPEIRKQQLEQIIRYAQYLTFKNII